MIILMIKLATIKNRCDTSREHSPEKPRKQSTFVWTSYHGEEREEQELAIGGYKYVFLVDLVASYLFEKIKPIFRPTIYHGIYQDDGMVVFKGEKKASEIKDWLE